MCSFKRQYGKFIHLERPGANQLPAVQGGKEKSTGAGPGSHPVSTASDPRAKGMAGLGPAISLALSVGKTCLRDRFSVFAALPLPSHYLPDTTTPPRPHICGRGGIVLARSTAASLNEHPRWKLCGRPALGGVHVQMHAFFRRNTNLVGNS